MSVYYINDHQPGGKRSLRRIWALSVAVLFLLVACRGTTATPTSAPATSRSFANPQFLVDTAWLGEHLADADVRIVDMRSESRYFEGHIPGAINLPVGRTDDPENPVPGEAMPQAEIEKLLEGLGIGPGDVLVIYDDGNLMSAARLFWILDLYGHERMSVLDGGYAKWLEEGRDVSQEVALVQGPYDYAATSQDEKLATKEWVLANLENPDVVLLDVRSEAEHRGGHIPRAINIEWSRAMMEGEVPILRPAGELLAMYEAEGVTPDKEVVTYCQTGQRGAHSYFVLRLLGYPQLRLYDGSWAEWGNDQALPAEQ